MSRYSVNLDRMRAFQLQPIAVLADVRGQGNPFNISVWSPGKQKVVKLPYRKRDGQTLITNLTPEAKHWAALSIPRWLVNREALWGHSDEGVSALCQEAQDAGKSLDQRCDNSERRIAQLAVNLANRYVQTPGTQFGISSRQTAAESWRNA